ncbi:Hypothetical predicted protein [Lecanosticta acicola]|uniref:NmrA-like domain-containing protein n=1 Tax=Lecanosticta acicola TaxID=111012 RepID=A0AAI8Z5A7_9PEZI|nr:Hypothetical predicted protein [Lecanosticta acicola]
MANNTVIVFGPTGKVASIAAQTARKHGSKVWLAMRDPSKSIPGLSAEEEKQGGYERVQADLTKPDTISAAVVKSGATRAFIYLAHGMPDHMKSTVEALKQSGVKFVVFLSSFTIKERELSDIPPDDFIPFIHAQVEINLEKIFGPENFVAIRPGAFATNAMAFWGSGIKAGEVELVSPDAKQDMITPDDMGRVSGTILANGPKDGQRHVYLFGPQLIAQEDALSIIRRKALEKEIKVTPVTDEADIRKVCEKMGFPAPMIDYWTTMMKQFQGNTGREDRPLYDEGVENTKRYTGVPAMKFEEWVEANKELFNS